MLKTIRIEVYIVSSYAAIVASATAAATTIIVCRVRMNEKAKLLTFGRLLIKYHPLNELEPYKMICQCAWLPKSMGDIEMTDNFVNETLAALMMMSFCDDDDRWKLPIGWMIFIIISFRSEKRVSECAGERVCQCDPRRHFFLPHSHTMVLFDIQTHTIRFFSRFFFHQPFLSFRFFRCWFYSFLCVF